MMTPVSGTMSREPNRRLMVVVKLMAIPDASAVTTWDVPGLISSASATWVGLLGIFILRIKRFQPFRIIRSYIQCMEIRNLTAHTCGRGLIEHFLLVFIKPRHEEGVSKVGSLRDASVPLPFTNRLTVSPSLLRHTRTWWLRQDDVC